MSKLESKLKENNIDTEKIKAIAEKHAMLIKKDLSSKDSKLIAMSVSKNLKNAYEEIKLSLPEQIAMSVLLLIIVYYIATYLPLILTTISYIILGYNSVIPSILSDILIVPIVEEYSKFFSIKKNFTGTYFIIFNIAEFTIYIYMLLQSGLGLVPAMMMRSLPVLMHGITTYIQYYMRKNAIDNKENPETASKIGLIVSIIIHSLWNISSATFDTTIRSLK